MMGHSSIKTTEIYAKMTMQFVSQNIDQKIFSDALAHTIYSIVNRIIIVRKKEDR